MTTRWGFSTGTRHSNSGRCRARPPLGKRAARNAAVTLALAGCRDVPVAQGALGPLVREHLIAAVLDLESGLDPERPDLDAVSLDPATPPT